ncbi:hypothetical protein GCM10023063_46500 [Arthrobacter methylotrophus]
MVAVAGKQDVMSDALAWLQSKQRDPLRVVVVGGSRPWGPPQFYRQRPSRTVKIGVRPPTTTRDPRQVRAYGSSVLAM